MPPTMQVGCDPNDGGCVCLCVSISSPDQNVVQRGIALLTALQQPMPMPTPAGGQQAQGKVAGAVTRGSGV